MVLTYRRSSDILLSIAGEDPDQRNACALACRALLLIDEISDTSIQLIVRNVKIIEGDDSILQERELLRSKVCAGDKLVEMRKTVDAFLESPSGFLTSP